MPKIGHQKLAMTNGDTREREHGADRGVMRVSAYRILESRPNLLRVRIGRVMGRSMAQVSKVACNARLYASVFPAGIVSPPLGLRSASPSLFSRGKHELW